MVDWAALADEVAAFVLSASCAGCDEPGALLCERCRCDLLARPMRTRTPEGMPVAAAFAFDGVVARCVRRVKEDGQTFLARPLGRALGEVVRGMTADHPEAIVVPVPTRAAAFRRRGYRVPELLMRRAGFRPVRLLVPARRVADQRGLDLEQRKRNVAGSMRARHAGAQRDVILFDDVVTTGATLDEAARALKVAGFRVIGAAALAATPRRRELTGNTS
jgi:predicted amidophosphoribosyltransferase